MCIIPGKNCSHLCVETSEVASMVHISFVTYPSVDLPEKMTIMPKYFLHLCEFRTSMFQSGNGGSRISLSRDGKASVGERLGVPACKLEKPFDNHGKHPPYPNFG